MSSHTALCLGSGALLLVAMVAPGAASVQDQDDRSRKNTPVNPTDVTSQPNAERPMSEQEFRSIGEAFDLDAYIAGLNPPTVEEIIASLAPTPTLEEVLEMVRHPETLPKPPTLPEPTAGQIGESKQRIEGLRKQVILGDTGAMREPALEEAIRLAEHVVQIRLDAGQPQDWYEVVDAQQQVVTLKHLRTLTTAARRELASSETHKAEQGRLYAAGEYERALPLAVSQLVVRRRIFPPAHPELATCLNDIGAIGWASGRHAVSERALCAALMLRRRHYAGDHPDVAQSLQSIASAIFARGAREESEQLCYHALAMRRRLFPRDHRDVANSLSNLARIIEERGALPEAEALHRDALAMRQRLFPGGHPDLAASLTGLARVLAARGQLEAAESLYREALASKQQQHSGDHPDLASGLLGLANILEARGALGEAESLHRDALAMYQRLFPGDSVAVATSLNNLAHVLQARGEFGEAELLFRQALGMRQRLFPGDHPQVATSLNNLAGILFFRGALAEAEPHLREALAMTQRLFPDGHPDIPARRYNLAAILKERGALAESEQLYREALRACRQQHPGDHPLVVARMSGLASILQDRGVLAEAEQLHRDALAMTRRLFSGDHPEVARCLNDLAINLQSAGAPAEAEPLCRDALAMYRRLFPGDHPAVATSLSTLAFVLSSRGALAEAELLDRDALAMRQRLFPGDHHEVATSLSNLASLLSARGMLNEAELLDRDALAMRQRLFPGDHPSVATSLSNLAHTLEKRGELAEVEALLRDVLAMRQRLFPGDHPRIASSLNDLAVILKNRGRLVQAESIQQDALAMAQRLFPGDHPDVAHYLYNLAGILQTRGALAEAEPFSREAFEISERMRTQIVGGERERAAFAQELDLNRRAISYARVLLQANRRNEATGILERGRARALLDLLERPARSMAAEIHVLGEPERARRLEMALADEAQSRISLNDVEILLVARQKERQALESRSDVAPDDRKAKLARFDQEIAGLVNDVAHKRQTLMQAGSDVLIALRGLFPVAQVLSTGEIRARLKRDEIVLTYAWSADTVLLIVTPPAGCGEVRSVFLAAGVGEVGELAERVRAVRQQLATRPNTITPALNAEELIEKLVPDEIRESIVGAKRLVILTDGLLDGIPFKALGIDIPIAYAPSATAYLRMQERRSTARGTDNVVVLGAPIFDRDAPADPDYPDKGVLVSMVVEGSNAAQAGLRRGDVILSYAEQDAADYQALVGSIDKVNKAVQAGERGADSRDVAVTLWRDGEEVETMLAPGRMGVQLDRSAPANGLRAIASATRSLESKAAEVSALDQVRLFGGSLPPLPGTKREAESIAGLFGDGAIVLIGDAATAPQLRESLRQRVPRFLHLATHGLTGSRERPYDASLALTMPESPSPDDIGFLTLDELLSHWLGKLKGCELAVLSACDTGRGIKRGDSVMMLPLGFHAAGVPTVVASLWKVDDTATSLLMVRLYENLLGRFDEPRTAHRRTYQPGECLSKLAALDEAKHWLRNLTRDELRKLQNSGPLAMVDDTPPEERGAEVAHQPVPDSADSDHPYEHPYYWSAFVLYGNPE